MYLYSYKCVICIHTNIQFTDYTLSVSWKISSPRFCFFHCSRLTKKIKNKNSDICTPTFVYVEAKPATPASFLLVACPGPLWGAESPVDGVGWTCFPKPSFSEAWEKPKSTTFHFNEKRLPSLNEWTYSKRVHRPEAAVCGAILSRSKKEIHVLPTPFSFLGFSESQYYKYYTTFISLF